MNQTEKTKIVESKEKIMMEAQFIGFLADLTNSALQFLGRLKDPRTNKISKNIKNAEKMIYVLEMLQTKTANNLTPSEKEFLHNAVTRLKKTHYEETRDPEKQHTEEIAIRHILTDSSEAAEEILAKLKSGDDFAELARIHSLCNSRTQDGFIDKIHRGDFPKSVEEAAFALQIDEVSAVIKSVLGYHLVKLVEKTDHD